MIATRRNATSALFRRSCVCVSVMMLLLSRNGLLRAQVANVDDQISSALARFQSDAWRTRAKGFYELTAVGFPGGTEGQTWQIPSAMDQIFKKVPQRKEEISVALIHLLETENDLGRRLEAKQTSETVDDEHTSYFGDLIACVGTLRDPRALDALLENIDTGNIATQAIAALGDASVDRVVALMNTHPRAAVRSFAANAVVKMLDPSIATIKTAEAKIRLEEGLKRAADDQFYGVRLYAVDGLSKMSGPDVTSILRRLAASDTYQRTRQAGGCSEVSFPIREAAQKALQSRPVEGK